MVDEQPEGEKAPGETWPAPLAEPVQRTVASQKP